VFIVLLVVNYCKQEVKRSKSGKFLKKKFPKYEMEALSRKKRDKFLRDSLKYSG